ncbi:NAD(P)-dependent oxidoreductase [Endozoicomonas arenosclerae]|uniref:NAD(P)-dependent oxidoreductase n=1 Tax=Endozoicomonas arenosclerae TaxID=1633495 RepID=UPI000783B6A3|nr:SDR family oxidoreductase [Endozoicomonas arenosclerae]
MKLVIFGATGRTGIQLVKQALDQGHEVTALTRSSSRLEITHARLAKVEGDVLDVDDVEAVIAGQDAVLCALGAPPKDQSMLRKRGTDNIIKAMKQSGVNRLICLSSLGFGETRDILPFFLKYFIFPVILKHATRDHAEQETLIKESALEWTIVRPGNLVEGNKTGHYKHGFSNNEKPLALKISRADVADFMLKQLKDLSYLHKTPGLSY